MRFRAVLCTQEPLERVVQTFHPTREQAEDWARKILKKRDARDCVNIFEARWEYRETITGTITPIQTVTPA
jgi:hypothetical protein